MMKRGKFVFGLAIFIFLISLVFVSAADVVNEKVWTIQNNLCVQIDKSYSLTPEFANNKSFLDHKIYSSKTLCDSALEVIKKANEGFNVGSFTGFFSSLKEPWNSVKTGIKGIGGFIGNKSLWFIGTKNWEGKDIGFYAFFSYLGFIPFMIIVILLSVGLFFLRKESPEAFNVAWAFLLVFIIFVFATMNPYSFFTGALAGLWLFIVFLLQQIGTKGYNTPMEGWIDELFREGIGRTMVTTSFYGGTSYSHVINRNYPKMFLRAASVITLIGAIFLGIVSIPVVSGFVKIITFEIIMPDAWFIRSFIIAFYIGFLPEAITRLIAYNKRKDELKKELDKKLGEAVLREAGKI